MLGKDAGYALHIVTGFDERSCYRYAGGERGVPGYLLRQLLRHTQGRQWLNAIMEGSDAPWWRELQRAERIAAQVDKINLD